jgi:hypothetical protein
MQEKRLPLREDFDSATQFAIRFLLAQLDDQTELLRKAVEELTAAQLEYQPAPGMNTIGMLLAHIAVAECYWMNVVTRGLPLRPDGDALMKEIIGINMDDDGMPCPAEGGHPETLRGWSAAEYLELIHTARAATVSELQRWSDSQLDELLKGARRMVSRGWVAYHVLEHLAGHFGQVLMLRHMMKDAGILAK